MKDDVINQLLLIMEKQENPYNIDLNSLELSQKVDVLVSLFCSLETPEEGNKAISVTRPLLGVLLPLTLTHLGLHIMWESLKPSFKDFLEDTALDAYAAKHHPRGSSNE